MSFFAVADESDRVACAVDEGLVVAELLHFGDDGARDAALLVRVAAYAHELAREFDYLFPKSVRQRHKPALPLRKIIRTRRGGASAEN